MRYVIFKCDQDFYEIVMVNSVYMYITVNACLKEKPHFRILPK